MSHLKPHVPSHNHVHYWSLQFKKKKWYLCGYDNP